MTTAHPGRRRPAARIRARTSAEIRRAGRDLVSWWRRSIQVRVVTTTLVLSFGVVLVLGALLLDQIASGLLTAKRDAALVEASAGFRDATRMLGDAQPATQEQNLGQELTQLTQSLASRGGPAGLYEVVLLRSSPGSRTDLAGRFPRASNQVLPDSVPDRLRERVKSEPRIADTYTEVRYSDGRSVPGLAVGARVVVSGAGEYELYYLFPLTQEQATLDLVRRTLISAGLFLVLLLGAIAWIVTRQVVTPVRMAAEVAERIAAGRLEERMLVTGEDELARLATSFNKMAAGLQRQIRRLEDLSRVQRRFVSDVSHELRTPLATVRMAADVLHEARGSFPPELARSAELLSAQIDRFEALLVDLLEISRFDAGAAVLETEPVDLRDLVAEAVETAGPLAERRGVRIVLEAEPQPCLVQADPRRVERIVRNLLGNAVEYGEGRDVVVRVAADERVAAVGVRDHGVGLRPGESALVFNRFWRADPARARTTGGTGLGLSIALEDTQLHQGWLQCWGAPGAGAHFRLTLPRRAGDQVEASPIPLVPADARSVGAEEPHAAAGTAQGGHGG